MAWQRTRISSLLCPFVGFSPGKHTLQREEGQYRSFTALTQLSYLISRASNGFADKSNCSQWEQWAADELSVKQKTQTERHFKGFFFFEKIENFSCLHLDQCLCLCWAVQRQTIRCNFILLHQLLHIPSQTAPLSRRFVRAPQWRDADRLSCLNGFSRAAERPAQQ